MPMLKVNGRIREWLDSRGHKVEAAILTPRDSWGVWASRRFASWRRTRNAIPLCRRQAGAQPAVEDREAGVARVPRRPWRA